MNQTFQTNASQTVIQTGPNAMIIVLMLISFWIVVINTLVLICLVMSRRALKNFVNLQILSFSVTDTLVGLSAIPVTMTYKIAESFPYSEPCAAVLYGYSVAQAATLYHAFVICIHRLITIKKCTGRSETNPRCIYKTLLIQISIPWIESLIVVAIPFLTLGKYGQVIKGCSLNTVFEDNYIYAMAFFNVNLLTPHLGMNIVYIYMLVFLVRQWKRVNVLKHGSRHGAAVSRSCSYTNRGDTTLDTNMTNTSISLAEPTQSDVNRLRMTENKFQSAKEENDVQNAELSGSVRNTQQDLSAVNEVAEGSMSKPMETKHDRKVRINGQMDVLITIGLLLLILNVFMSPLTFLSVVESLNVDLLSRRVKFIIMILALMNSALNPFVYVYRIKPFRKILRDISTKLYGKICR